QYIRLQKALVEQALKDANKSLDKANRIFKSGDPLAKITKTDIQAIELQIQMVQAKLVVVENGMEKAIAALKEAIGLAADHDLRIDTAANRDSFLPAAVYKVVEKEPRWIPVYTLDRQGLIAAGVANRGEIVQAAAASRLTELEIAAQCRIRGVRG